MQHSNAYIIGFAAAVCLVCSIVVSTSAVALRPRQIQNKELDRQKQVLMVAGLIEAGQAADAAEIQRLFDESIVARAVDLETGEYDESVDTAAYDQRKATRDPALSRAAGANPAGIPRLPNTAVIYQKVVQDEVEMVILPIEGKGLWSTLYGFLALAPDLTTIEGITFYEHGETPGLGGEVDNPSWKALWPGRQAFDDSGEVAIEVIKGHAGPVDQDPYRVDGLSGSTLTARGVSNLVRFWLSEDGFGPYLEQIRTEEGGA
ncbi:MAG: Na(+)-translocating NADH-quinone reductase subunit C [Thermoanaerobaculales bacterium]|jgi:Na+-transporting NADH:ubiquinone oxidoreductase subunit C|nr:Na(+)-translocating NADH-quinone reductase subunit C [Thermoanaerobaculales bacterium]